jgi:hypothetical protein
MAWGAVQFQRLPLRVAQLEILGQRSLRCRNRRRLNPHRGTQFGEVRLVRNDVAALARVRAIPPTPTQRRPKTGLKQTVSLIRQRGLQAFYRPCAHCLDKSSVAQSWTEASRGDRISPKHVIIQRSDKCNIILIILMAGSYGLGCSHAPT